jgi:hypothetical protein
MVPSDLMIAGEPEDSGSFSAAGDDRNYVIVCNFGSDSLLMQFGDVWPFE